MNKPTEGALVAAHQAGITLAHMAGAKLRQLETNEERLALLAGASAELQRFIKQLIKQEKQRVHR